VLLQRPVSLLLNAFREVVLGGIIAIRDMIDEKAPFVVPGVEKLYVMLPRPPIQLPNLEVRGEEGLPSSRGNEHKVWQCSNERLDRMSSCSGAASRQEELYLRTW
jgi:hypothetical protein